MEREIIEIPQGKIARFFRVKPEKILIYGFKSVEELLANQDKGDIYSLKNLKVLRKTAEAVGTRHRYHFILSDNTGQIMVKSSTEYSDINPLNIGSRRWVINYSPAIWSEIVSTREEDVIDIACEPLSKDIFILTKLKNKSLEGKVVATSQK